MTSRRGGKVGDLSRGHWDTFIQWRFKTDERARLGLSLSAMDPSLDSMHDLSKERATRRLPGRVGGSFLPGRNNPPCCCEF